MNWEIIIKTISVLVIIKSLLLLVAPQIMIDLTKKIVKSKQNLRKVAMWYLICGLIVYFLAYKLL